MQFLVVAHDGADDGAPARRAAVRDAHIDGAKAMAQSGAMICGGALLGEGGAMIGSACIVEFEDRAALDAWLADDPYVTGGVWQDIEVTPFRRAV
jgi:uncharacterized protein YciI